jgi:hypothetical protein
MYLVDWSMSNWLVPLTLLAIIIIPVIALWKMFGGRPGDPNENR